jgi:hypothetical protein
MNGMDEPESIAYLVQPRQRIRRLRSRQSAWFILLVWAPLVTLIAAANVFEPHNYPADDPRNEPLFWLTAALVTVVFVAVMLAFAVRRLRQTDQG